MNTSPNRSKNNQKAIFSITFSQEENNMVHLEVTIYKPKPAHRNTKAVDHRQATCPKPTIDLSLAKPPIIFRVLDHLLKHQILVDSEMERLFQNKNIRHALNRLIGRHGLNIAKLWTPHFIDASTKKCGILIYRLEYGSYDRARMVHDHMKHRYLDYIFRRVNDQMGVNPTCH
ncbi:hypothetical protein L1F30_14945 [Simiduia sp. 21SJ11W-1]|uniref:hypothetical protein n=1 Tax=Simiduia sp. 21SJ11W-1 TaxID=2909669 RepID=UPI0020A0FBE9|nr:hypothetical protein [Simiduia sp. 21SJ11W-1]UTA47444.1 hypothetical protein L1F30_14945 [Simiduia sp. 21SJ11W-1]